MIMTFEELKKSSLKYGIKVVWHDWHSDLLRSKRVGFNPRYEKVLSFVPGDEMFVYLTKYQILFGLYKVKGNWKLGKNLYPEKGRFSSVIPVDLLFDAQNGVPLRQIQQIIPKFDPTLPGVSYVPIDLSEYNALHNLMITNG